ncbi:hypothetical protein V3C33_16670 [Micrococcaceae bacterium Sec5.7]
MNDQDPAQDPKPDDIPRAVPPRPPAPPASQQPAAPPMKTRHARPDTTPDTARLGLFKAAFVLVLLIVGGLLIWLVASLLANANQQPGNGGATDSGTPGVVETTVSAPASALPLPRGGVSALDFHLGDCFKDFDPEALGSTVVACNTGHSAQLVALFRYPAEDSYPGSGALKAKALEACQAAKLTTASSKYKLIFQRAYPSTTSWEKGDRRVDCYITAETGNVIMSSVLP